MAAILNHIEALEARILNPTSGNSKKTNKKKQMNPFLVDKPKKKNEKKDPLAVGSGAGMTEPTETELKLNTIQDFYGSSSDSDNDDEEYGDDMESVDQSEDEANGKGVTKYHHRKNYFHFYRGASGSPDDTTEIRKKRTKLYYAQRIFVVKTIFAFCMFIMMGGAVVKHKHSRTGTGKGANFVPASAARDYLPDHEESGNKQHQDSNKNGEQMTMIELLDEKVEKGEMSVAVYLDKEAGGKKSSNDKAYIDDGLPDGWREFTDKSTGKPYYEDPNGHVTWELPSSETGSTSETSSINDIEDEEKEEFIAETSKFKSAALPDGWREFTDKKSGKDYYMDPQGHTTWERPASENQSPPLSLEESDSISDSDASKGSLPPGWREYKDQVTGKFYYMDPHGKTTWDRPSE